MNIHDSASKGPEQYLALVKFSDHEQPGLFMHSQKIAQFPQNFREIARLLPQGNPRAVACAKWLQMMADEIENAQTAKG